MFSGSKSAAGMNGAASTWLHCRKSGSIEWKYRWWSPLASTVAWRARCIDAVESSGMAKAPGSSTVARVVATASIMVLVSMLRLLLSCAVVVVVVCCALPC
jgi:hypothetical protein